MGLKHKQLWIVLAANIILCVLFASSNLSIWREVNLPDRQSHWDATWIQVNHIQVPGVPPVSGFILMLNWPFWLFWISTAVNVLFVFNLIRKQEKEDPTVPS